MKKTTPQTKRRTVGTVSIDTLKRIFGFKENRTAYAFLKKANITIGRDKYMSMVDVAAILKYMKVKELPERFLHIDEAAKLLGTTEKKLTLIMRSGVVPFYKTNAERGSKYFFVKEELEQFKVNAALHSIDLSIPNGYMRHMYKLEQYDSIFGSVLRYLEASEKLFSKKELRIIRSIWIEGKSNAAIEPEIGIARGQIAIIYKQAMQKLRDKIGELWQAFDERDALLNEAAILKAKLKQRDARIEELTLRLGSASLAETKEPVPENVAEIQMLLVTPVSKLPFSNRAIKCFIGNGISQLGDLVSLTENDLRKLRNLGDKTLTEITDIVRQKNLNLGMKVGAYFK